MKKGLALVLALVLLVVGAVAGTLAWLTDTSDTVTNTFTTSDITVKLEESKGTASGTTNVKNFKMIPGYSLDKDPKAWVVAGSEKCYLFVKLEKSTNFGTYMSYEVDTGTGAWTKLTGEGIADTDEIYYRVVKADEMGDAHKFSILKGDKVSVKGEVTKAQMNGLTETTYPTLKVTAYASQYQKNATEHFEAIEAWNNLGLTSTSTNTNP